MIPNPVISEQVVSLKEKESVYNRNECERSKRNYYNNASDDEHVMGHTVLGQETDEILLSIPLELIMLMQEKTAVVDVEYLTKHEVVGGVVSYRAITKDVLYLFDEKMVFKEIQKRSVEQLTSTVK